ncbi:MAG: SUMF1/EgtB/PvdO family nonheme iron enzyme [Saprospiraceae bacterium]|nr:SUMF1/EgtB/PvdO family nonheme iron enzyme [Saprospiraceae bacterium]
MKKIILFGLIGMLFAATSCKKEMRSDTTGWAYNSQEWGGFEKVPDYKGQITGPNLAFIEGGTFNMGQTEEDVMFDYRNIARRVTVSSFYMDESEITNIAYLEYLYWLGKVHGTLPQVRLNALPDTLVWLEELAYNEPFVETYFRHPAYVEYPVVGVNWLQCQEYCKWRSDRVNEMILIEQGKLAPDPEGQQGENNFTTGSYLYGLYEGTPGNRPMRDYTTGDERTVKFEDGVLLPNYRLPMEVEWEFAALALVGNQSYARDERITDRRLYPWDGTTVRYPQHGAYQGMIVANFKRGRGDYMGMAGALNDNAHITSPVRAYVPNDYGLYCMAGNVSEWVQDVYRPMTSTSLRDVETHDLNPFRGNVFMQMDKNEDGVPTELDSLGRLKYKMMDDKDIANRRNFQTANVINHLDGDKESEAIYEYGKTTLISDKARVYKGGSWADRAYWLSPGARRFLDEDKASSTIGFRCAMTRVGSPKGNRFKGGNQIKTKKRRSVRKYK